MQKKIGLKIKNVDLSAECFVPGYRERQSTQGDMWIEDEKYNDAISVKMEEQCKHAKKTVKEVSHASAGTGPWGGFTPRPRY